MAKQRGASPKQKEEQKKRTANNMVRKYEKLLEESPNSPHAKKWQSNLDFYLARA